MEEAMDSNDERMFTALMVEEAAVAFTDEEHLMMLSCLIAMYAHDGAKPQREGLAQGCHKSKPRERMEGYNILYTDYISKGPLHDEVYAISG
jgi:hypothetical protein